MDVTAPVHSLRGRKNRMRCSKALLEPYGWGAAQSDVMPANLTTLANF
jgi:hypothetical protein